MEYRKRARLEVIAQNDELHCLSGPTGAPLNSTTATLTTIGGQSYLLSGHAGVLSGQAANNSTSLPANILLTICDENSEESQEYLIDSSLLSQIKQEHNVGTQTSPPPLPLPLSQSTSLAQNNNLMTLTPQYRLITNTNNNNNNNNDNNSNKVLNNSSAMVINTAGACCSAGGISTTTAANLLTNAVQLPTGCEIYLIKELMDSPANSGGNVAVDNDNGVSKGSTNTTTIKIEPGTQVVTNSLAATNDIQLVQAQPSHGHNSTDFISTANTKQHACDDATKRSFILETYKKRDDKRRATHNEVERRRRDKINSWIFKLKEMLPSDTNVIKQQQQQQQQQLTRQHNTKDSQTINVTTTTTTTATVNRLLPQSQQQQTQQQQHTNARTPPNDSKSQILIKACEYIKNMQDEIKSLRQCLTENESLRLCNQRLQDELHNLRHKQEPTNSFIGHSNTNSIGAVNVSGSASNECAQITLNALNSNTTYANVQLYAATTCTAACNENEQQQQLDRDDLITTNTTTTPDLTYTKSELIIRDYVD